jgi:hypothetical protein
VRCVYAVLSVSCAGRKSQRKPCSLLVVASYVTGALTALLLSLSFATAGTAAATAAAREQ